jgi:hypothetical protein
VFGEAFSSRADTRGAVCLYWCYSGILTVSQSTSLDVPMTPFPRDNMGMLTYLETVVTADKSASRAQGKGKRICDRASSITTAGWLI